MYDPAKVAQALDRLFRTYPSFQAGEAADEALRVYFEAVEPYQTGDILDAAQNFITGTAPGVNPSFAPPAPAVAAECRRVMNLRLESEARSKKPALPPPDVVKSAESRERVRLAAAGLISSLAEQARTEEASKVHDRKSWQDRMDNRFAPDQSEDRMRLRLNIGDPEGDEDTGWAA